MKDGAAPIRSDSSGSRRNVGGEIGRPSNSFGLSGESQLYSREFQDRDIDHTHMGRMTDVAHNDR